MVTFLPIEVASSCACSVLRMQLFVVAQVGQLPILVPRIYTHSPLQNLLTQPRKVWIVRRDVQIQAPQRMVHLDSHAQRQHAGNLNLKVSREVEVDETRRLGQEFGESDGARRREVGRVEEYTLEVRMDGNGCAESRDLCEGRKCGRQGT